MRRPARHQEAPGQAGVRGSRLRDEELAQLALAPITARPGDLARQLGRPYNTVHAALRRLRLAGGWSCPLVWATCRECGQLLATGREPSRRSVHVACLPPRAQRRRQAYAQAHPRVPGEAARLVRVWRAQNPERAQRLKEREHQQLQARAAVSRAGARASGGRWSAAADAYLRAHWGEPVDQVAAAMGRTLWAVRARWAVLRKQQ